MSTLADPLDFNAPPAEFLNSITNLSLPAKTLLWYGLSPRTRQGYNTAINSYTFFCASKGVKSWPATETVLIEWITGQVFRSAAPKQGQIKPNTAQSYLSALKSYHTDYNFSTHAFASLRLDRILNSACYFFPHTKKERLPITKDILQKITSVSLISIDELNIDTIFKIAWAGFLQMNEFTYTSAEAQASTFTNTKLTRSDVTFSDRDQHEILRLKQSKTNINHSGVEIILAATHDTTCSVTALRNLFYQDPQPRTSLLFHFQNDTGSTAFSSKLVLNIFQNRLQLHNIATPKSYTGHSFQKGAAQHASDNEMLDQHIQKLGR